MQDYIFILFIYLFFFKKNFFVLDDTERQDLLFCRVDEMQNVGQNPVRGDLDGIYTIFQQHLQQISAHAHQHPSAHYVVYLDSFMQHIMISRILINK